MKAQTKMQMILIIICILWLLHVYIVIQRSPLSGAGGHGENADVVRHYRPA